MKQKVAKGAIILLILIFIFWIFQAKRLNKIRLDTDRTTNNEIKEFNRDSAKKDIDNDNWKD